MKAFGVHWFISRVYKWQNIICMTCRYANCWVQTKNCTDILLFNLIFFGCYFLQFKNNVPISCTKQKQNKTERYLWLNNKFNKFWLTIWIINNFSRHFFFCRFLSQIDPIFVCCLIYKLASISVKYFCSEIFFHKFW